MTQQKITVAYGDGIGPEIMKATMKILEAAGADLAYDVIEVGEKMFLGGNKAGIDPSSWDLIKKNKVFLKAPITTPQGGGYKSLNVTARKNLGLYANVRPVRAYAPYVKTHHPDMNMVIVRENEEDLYAGIEYALTSEITESLKLISKSGSEKIVRYAFEYARINGRKKVTCMTKDNIMKLADGLFHKTFDQVAKEYPTIEAEHKIIDIGSALIADTPEDFEVIVTENLYGDIISDIAAQVAGSVGMMGSSNIGTEFAMFEAIHGSAPDIAGKQIANPSGLLNGAVLMLQHLGQHQVAAAIQNAWLKTLEDGIHTGDIYQEGKSSQKANTSEFADAVIARLGQLPAKFTPVTTSGDAAGEQIKIDVKKEDLQPASRVGMDIFLNYKSTGKGIGDLLNNLNIEGLDLAVVTKRGHCVYVNGQGQEVEGHHWRCRFYSSDQTHVAGAKVVELLQKLNDLSIDFVKMESLNEFDGQRGYSLAPGE